MRLEKANVLTKDEKKKILDLQNEVFKYDNLSNEAFLSNEINFDKSLPCFYMCYEGDELIGFLTTFMPESRQAEVSAFTHPEYRRKGCFNSLLKAAEEVLSGAGIRKILFVVESTSTTALEVLKKKNLSNIEYSEYKMSCTHPAAVNPRCDLEFIKIDNNNKDAFEMISEDAFPEVESNEKFTNIIISSQDREGYIGYKDNEPVGCFNMQYEDNKAFIYGVGVLSKYRGQGVGKAMIKFALDKGLKKFNKAVLEVDSGNPAAFNLYKKSGFSIDLQQDYYIYEF